MRLDGPPNQDTAGTSIVRSRQLRLQFSSLAHPRQESVRPKLDQPFRIFFFRCFLGNFLPAALRFLETWRRHAGAYLWGRRGMYLEWYTDG
jgi:hypothetical protein